jgi:short-subunit dehydrogenase/catechol 2,3-dioxygenase-like lactoylglutathione lyase family enzyme
VDVLVNNAGIGWFSPLETTSDETIRHLFETNAFGVMAMVRAIVPHMRERGSGTIVNVTSSVIFNPVPLVALYAATKTAVDGLSEALYYELAPLGIRVKMVEPGYGPGTNFETNMMALSDVNAIPAFYQGVLGALMGHLPEVTTTVQDVAEAVLRAVNDTSPTLRFPAGADSVAIARKRAELSEEAFLAMMRQSFGVPQHYPHLGELPRGVATRRQGGGHRTGARRNWRGEPDAVDGPEHDGHVAMQATTATTTGGPLRTLPLRLHHHAYTTDNHETTRHFYEDILGLPLRAMYTEREHIGNELIELGHAFYGLGDGSALAFFNFADPVKQREWRAKEQSLFIHISLKVEQSTQDEIRERVQAAGIDLFTIDHGYCQSLYFRDPNGLQLEFTVDPPEAGEINARTARTARDDMRRWMAGGRESNNHWRVAEENAAVV